LIKESEGCVCIEAMENFDTEKKSSWETKGKFVNKKLKNTHSYLNFNRSINV
jgi:hypothetical protein